MAVPLDTLRRGGIRDVRMIRKLLRRPDWVVPDGAEKALPVELYLIAHNRTRDGSPADYKVNMRIKAAEVIMNMKAQNDRKLTTATRLKQIAERTEIMRQHPELTMGGNVTTNNVVIVLPEKASLAEFELPSERTVEPAK